MMPISQDPPGLSQILSRLLSTPSPVVLATLVRVKGVSQHTPVVRWVLAPEDRLTESLEQKWTEQRSAVLFEGRSSLMTYELGPGSNLAWGMDLGVEGWAEVLMEPMFPGRIPPWVHFTAQLLEQHRRGVLATVLETRGDVPYLLGEIFALDEHSHGLLPIDRDLSESLHHAAQRCLSEGRAHLDWFTVIRGHVELLVEPVFPEQGLQ